MKRFTLFLTLLLVISLAYGQKIKPSSSITPYAEEMKTLAIAGDPMLKSEGELFYRETFNWKDETNPRGWSLPEGWQIVDVTEYGTPWVWRAGTDSIRGKWSFEKGHRYSHTPEDGFIVIPMDEYNFQDGVLTDYYGTSWFQLPSIDCSAHPTVVLKFQQYFRCNVNVDVKVWVSNDQGVHWSVYDVSYGTIINIFCKKPNVEINISDVAGGMPDIWIRYVWNSMRYYFWAIDDITLSEAYNNELQLEKAWLYMTDLEVDDDEGFVYMVPFSQAGADAFGGYTFRAGFLNGGRDDQESCHLNAEVFRNGVSVYSMNSTREADIWALERDTFEITTPFVPEDYGNYEMVLTARQDQADGLPGNNAYRDTYYVTDSVYSNSDWDFETYSSTAGFGNNDGDYLGIVYDIKQACEVNSISTLIMQRPENRIACTQPGYSFQYWIFRWDETEALWVETISSDYIEVTQEMLNTWVTLEFLKDGESEFLDPGQYIAAIQVYHGGGAGADNNQYRFTIGSDRSHEYAPGKTVYRLYDSETWNQNRDLSMIRLNINATGAPATADVMFNVDMTLPITNGYFNPGSDFVDVAGTFNNWNGSDHFADTDGDGVYSLTVPGLPVFENLGYRYRINGNDNTAELPSGPPYRTCRTSYYNMLHDVYNNGISMGVDTDVLNTSLSIYPNPSDGVFILDISTPRVTDLNIKVHNLQGRMVFGSRIPSVARHRETLDLSSQPAGMYFLNINGKVVKLLIR